MNKEYREEVKKDLQKTAKEVNFALDSFRAKHGITPEIKQDGYGFFLEINITITA